MDDMNRWLKDREACGFGGRKLPGHTLQVFQETVGKRYSALTAVEYAKIWVRPDRKGTDHMWRCQCSCGSGVERVVRRAYLEDGSIKSCGSCSRLRVHTWSEQVLRKLALSLEFEGSVGVYDTPKITIGVRDYSVEVLDRLHREVGLGAVTEFTKEDGRPMVQWQVPGSDAMAIARAVAPFMVCKRKQIDAVISYPMGDRRTKVTPDVRRERDSLMALTSELNKRGPKPVMPEWGEHAEKWIRWAATAPLHERMEILALSIEWEGHLNVHERKNDGSSRGVSHQMEIGVSQSSHRACLLEMTQSLSGGFGRVGKPKVSKRPGNSPISRWGVESISDAKTLARGLIPFLQCKKRLAEIITEFPEWDRAPLPMPQEMFNNRRALSIESKMLNKKFPPHHEDAITTEGEENDDEQGEEHAE